MALHRFEISPAAGLQFADAELALAPVVIAEGVRVALGDEIGQQIGSRLVLVLIGGRPGLSSLDSLGAYETFAPAMRAAGQPPDRGAKIARPVSARG